MEGALFSPFTDRARYRWPAAPRREYSAANAGVVCGRYPSTRARAFGPSEVPCGRSSGGLIPVLRGPASVIRA
jgi:hypothetical protein